MKYRVVKHQYRWDGQEKEIIYCSNCGEIFDQQFYTYCYQCGKKVDWNFIAPDEVRNNLKIVQLIYGIATAIVLTISMLYFGKILLS